MEITWHEVAPDRIVWKSLELALASRTRRCSVNSVSGVNSWIARPDCSSVGRVIRWRYRQTGRLRATCRAGAWGLGRDVGWAGRVRGGKAPCATWRGSGGGVGVQRGRPCVVAKELTSRGNEVVEPVGASGGCGPLCGHLSVSHRLPGQHPQMRASTSGWGLGIAGHIRVGFSSTPDADCRAHRPIAEGGGGQRPWRVVCPVAAPCQSDSEYRRRTRASGSCAENPKKTQKGAAPGRFLFADSDQACIVHAPCLTHSTCNISAQSFSTGEPRRSRVGETTTSQNSAGLQQCRFTDDLRWDGGRGLVCKAGGRASRRVCLFVAARPPSGFGIMGAAPWRVAQDPRGPWGGSCRLPGTCAAACGETRLGPYPPPTFISTGA